MRAATSSNPRSCRAPPCSATHQRSGEREGSYQETHYLLRLVCPCTETGALGLEVSASLYRRNPRSVLLEYTSESLLGLWGDRLAVTSVDGEDGP